MLNINSSSETNSVNPTSPQPEKTLGLSTEFNPDEWIIDSFSIDKEGFYCTTKNNFDFWSIWSKATYSPVINTIKIKVKVKPKTNSSSPPTLAVSYGEFKKNYSPVQFYRLNIFDTDTKTIRLYDDKNKSLAQGWLSNEPDLSSEMSIVISPRNSNPNLRTINLNPILEYAVFNQTNTTSFIPTEIFEVALPTVGIDDGTVKKQIGIGSSKQTCFKPIAFEVKE